MKTIIIRCLGAVGLMALAIGPAAFAQSYSVTSHVISGGGGTSTNGQFTVSGTIGQSSASGAMTNGQYSATSGFWNLINVVQMPGVPNLSIFRTAPNNIVLTWPDPGTNTYTLQQNASFGTTNWVTSGLAISNASGTNSVTINSPVGKLFFRLKQ